MIIAPYRPIAESIIGVLSQGMLQELPLMSSSLELRLKFGHIFGFRIFFLIFLFSLILLYTLPHLTIKQTLLIRCCDLLCVNEFYGVKEFFL